MREVGVGLQALQAVVVAVAAEVALVLDVGVGAVGKVDVFGGKPAGDGRRIGGEVFAREQRLRQVADEEVVAFGAQVVVVL